MYNFRNSNAIRRRWLLYRTLAIIFFVVGLARLLYEVFLLVTGVRLDGLALALIFMVFGVPAAVLWVRSKDLATWWREEVEREELSNGEGNPQH